MCMRQQEVPHRKEGVLFLFCAVSGLKDVNDIIWSQSLLSIDPVVEPRCRDPAQSPVSAVNHDV